jgi:hypothetical protein
MVVGLEPRRRLAQSPPDRPHLRVAYMERAMPIEGQAGMRSTLGYIRDSGGYNSPSSSDASGDGLLENTGNSCRMSNAELQRCPFSETSLAPLATIPVKYKRVCGLYVFKSETSLSFH